MQEEHRHHLDGRLGLNVPRGTWPTPALLKAYEAAGFAWVQVHTPPLGVLAEREDARRHARALRAVLDATALRLLVHGPDDLSAGTDLHDRALAGLLDYAAEAGAELVAYHGLNFRASEDAIAGRAVAERVELEERALRRFAPVAARLGLRVCVENLAPTYPSPPRVCHDPREVAAFVRRLDSPAVAMLFDAGHAHIAAGLRRGDAAAQLDDVADAVGLFHLHDNLGARRHELQAPGVDPLRLDLHLPPGAGTLAWERLAPALAGHDAPLVLEIGAGVRQEPVALAAAARAALTVPVARAAA
ncbi:MAG TPA: sugar phosphate isomerase/epimerase [Capillimicrobium sp.]|nr:sugar phosphate isomerase/epimerase [Capillimicrobium sp.]